MAEYWTSVRSEAIYASFKYAKLKPSVIEAMWCGTVEGIAAAGLPDSFWLEHGSDTCSRTGEQVGARHTPPGFAVSDTIFDRRVAETVFTIEAAGPFGNSVIELVHLFFRQGVPVSLTSPRGRGEGLTVVCGAYHEDAVIIFQPIELVEEIASHFIRDQTVYILKQK